MHSYVTEFAVHKRIYIASAVRLERRTFSFADIKVGTFESNGTEIKEIKHEATVLWYCKTSSYLFQELLTLSFSLCLK
jgi:hypothetical protein